MDRFMCGGCDKPIKTTFHKCWVHDKTNSQVYVPRQTKWVHATDGLIWHWFEDPDFSDSTWCSDGSDGLPYFPGYYGNNSARVLF